MVLLAEKQLLAAVAPRHDMVYGPQILESQLPCHAPTKLQKTPESTPNSNFEGLTPWTPDLALRQATMSLRLSR